MDNFIVSARKYRPVTFDSVVGQQHITSTLKNAIRNKQLAQAFLFCGPRGVGKTTCARILAKTINCEQPTEQIEACGTCGSCQSFQNSNSFSIHELDAASNNSVDDIRSLIDQVRIPPQQGNYKIYIIDEVHMLSQQAFNAFLKTLEEPPPYAIFILATTEKHRILPTILSRCQIFDFNRIRVEDMAEHLKGIAEKENIAYEYDGLHVIARKADGGLRDALSMFDQIVSFSDKQVTYQAVITNLNVLDSDYYFKISDAIHQGDVAAVLVMFDEILGHGFDGSHFIGGLASHFRDLLVSKAPATVKLLEVSDQIRQRYLEQASAISTGLLLSALNIANQCEINYKTSKNPRLQVELALMKMCHIRSALSLSKLPIATAEKNAGSTETAPEKKKPEPVAAPEATKPVATPAQPAEVPTKVPVAAPETTPTAVPVATPAPAEAPKPTAASWSKAKLSVGLDLNDLGSNPQEEDKEPVLVSGDVFEPIQMDVLLKEWHALADRYKAANKINIFTLLTAHPPRLVGDAQIEMVIENTIQRDLLVVEKPDMVNALRQSLRNYAIHIQEVLEDNPITRKPYTAQEKYQAMIQKNEILDRLRQDFNLGLE